MFRETKIKQKKTVKVIYQENVGKEKKKIERKKENSSQSLKHNIKQSKSIQSKRKNGKKLQKSQSINF